MMPVIVLIMTRDTILNLSPEIRLGFPMFSLHYLLGNGKLSFD